MWVDRAKKAWKMFKKKLRNDTENLNFATSHSILNVVYVNGLIKSNLWALELATLDDNFTGSSVYLNTQKMYNKSHKLTFKWANSPKFDKFPDEIFSILSGEPTLKNWILSNGALLYARLFKNETILRTIFIDTVRNNPKIVFFPSLYCFYKDDILPETMWILK